ncbi:MAG: DNA primase [bacterium]
MAGPIPEAFIQDLLARADIVDVINPRVPLKRGGREYSACCPFHNEKTPSFTVSPQKQFFHCFGCGEHGTAIGFLMKYEGLEFVDAVEELAQMNGMEVPREAARGPRIDPGQYEIMHLAADYFQNSLRNAVDAQNYIQQRGLDQQTQQEFMMGWAPDLWDGLVKFLREQHISIEKMEQLGLVTRKGDRVYDRFRGRLIFPIADRRGRVIAFGGRIIEGDGPKYLNSPETPLFHKGRELYSLARARSGAAKVEKLLVVEGYMDVVSLWQHGLHYAVATLGTATTHDHGELLFRAAPEVIFCFDGDKAGRRAAWRALENVISCMRDGRSASFLFLPDGEDPDSLIQKEGLSAFEQRYKQAVPLSEFLFQSLEQGLDMTRIDQRASFAEKSRALLNRLPDSFYRGMVFDDLAKRARIPEGMRMDQGPRLESLPDNAVFDEKVLATPARMAVAVCIQYPELVSNELPIVNDRLDFSLGERLYMEIRSLLQQNYEITTAGLLEHFRGREEASFIDKLVQAKLLGSEDQIRQILIQSVRRMELELAKKSIKNLEQEMLVHGIDSARKERFRELQSIKVEADRLLSELQKNQA